MRVPRLLLALFGVAGAVDIIGVWLDSPPLYLRAELVALLALAGYVALAGRAHPARVRWPLLAAVAVPAVAVVVELATYHPEPPPDLTHIHALLFETSDPNPYRQMLLLAGQNAVRALPILAVLVPAAVAVLALPARWSRRVTLVAGGLALLVTVPLASFHYDTGRTSWIEWWDRPAVPVVGGLVFAVVPAVVLATAAVAVTVSARRAPLAALGVALLVVPGAFLVGPAGFAGIHQPIYEQPRPPGTEYGVAVSIISGRVGSGDPGLAVLRAFVLAGIVLVVLGCLAARRDRPAALTDE